MKTKNILIIVYLTMACTVLGIKMLPFPGWERVKEKSPDIIIARCTKTIEDPRTYWDGINSSVEVLSTLKGRTNLGPAKLFSTIWPRQGEIYLIFSIYHDGFYQATEPYRIVPLGTYVPPDLLAGKTLDEKIHILFQRRLDDLNRLKKEEEEEKQRLEDGLKK